MCCEVHFYRSRRYQVLYQKSIHAVLIISVCGRRQSFISDHEVIVIAAGGLGEGAPPAGRFYHYGSLSLPSNFSPPHESLSSPYCYLKWDTKWINSQRDVKKIFCLWRVFLWEFAIQKLLIPSLQQNFYGECHHPTEQALMENPGGSRKELWLGFRRQNPIFLLFKVGLSRLWKFLPN